MSMKRGRKVNRVGTKKWEGNILTEEEPEERSRQETTSQTRRKCFKRPFPCFSRHPPTLRPTIILSMDPKLYLAATSGDAGFLEQVANAVNRTQLLTTQAPRRNTALHIASRFGNAAFSRKILQLCSHLLRMKNSDDDTALHCAARAGCHEIVEILMDNTEGGSSSVELLRIQNKEGDTALHEALRNRHKDIAIKMVQADPKLAFVVNNAKESSFLVAAKEEMVEVVKEILLSDTSANSGEQRAAAISNSSSDIVIPIVALPQLTADEKRELIRMQDNTGKTALHYASWRNNTKIVHMILLTDSLHVPYITDNNGHSPLHMAVAFGMQKSMLELLKQCPDSIEQLDTSNRNVLHIALLNRRHEIIQELLKLPHVGGLLNGPDKKGNTPLHLASKKRIHTSLLVDGRAKLTIRNKDGRTALGVDRIRSLAQLGVGLNKCPSGPIWGWPQQIPDVIPIKKPSAEGGSTSKRQIFLVIASLIATVSFTAAFTLPGGYRSDNETNSGIAVLAAKPAFKTFVLLDTFAMCLSTGAIYCYIVGWGLEQRRQSFYAGLFMTVGNVLTIVACFCMLFALSAGVFTAVGPQNLWLAITVLAICSLLPCLRLGLFIVYFFFSVSHRRCRTRRVRKQVVRMQNV